MTLCGHRPEGGWDGCETISVFAFTGVPPQDVVRENSDCTLRDLDADSITTYTLNAPTDPEVSAVRSSGYLSAAARRIWAQYSTYLAGSVGPDTGIVIEHVVFIDAGCRARLRDDIADLSDAVHEAFLARLDTVVSSDEPVEAMEVNQDGA
jgi:hypothetical protein